ncbi:hypothetical protein VEZ01S_44_00060 [Vibrio ezurae NBRC 102218]|uniref:Uncharacterized protein n=1 Tax=Vibrio ezurae NBRC 102218 TaxID=1219080 RepID=U3CRQ8_9VIBR|nr:hypothetical protein VEZ01S_44_00060 [Vibrio ezurae NBRC 102218]
MNLRIEWSSDHYLSIEALIQKDRLATFENQNTIWQILHAWVLLFAFQRSELGKIIPNYLAPESV